jgi:hypothetical protein
MDPDADPDLQDTNKKPILKKVFHHFSKIKSQQEVTKQ